MAVLTAVETSAIDVVARSAREYLRVSKGRGRTARSITDQHRDNLAAEEDHGPWKWGEPYKDTGSASKYARKARDDFDKLLADLGTGEFGNPGDVLVLWEISRLARETGKGVALVDACEAGGYLIHITSHERTYSPANYQDRHSLISGINDAEKEARLLSARTRRGINSAAREGRPHGRVPLGYAREYQIIDARPRAVRQHPDAVWGPRIKELFERAAGSEDKLPETIYSIAKDWESRGWWIPEKVEDDQVIPSRPFTAQHLRAFLIRPVYAGLRRFKGQLLPEWDGMESVVSRELFDRVQRVLADPSRRTYLGGGVRWVLSTTLKCDRCSGPMVVGKHSGKLGYECQRRGCCWVPKGETDRILIGDLEHLDPVTGESTPRLGVILKYLAAPDRHAAVRRRPDVSGKEKTVVAELARLRGELKELEDAPRPKTARARIQRTEDMEEMETDIDRLEVERSKLTAPAPLAGLLPDEPITDVVAWWTQAGVEKQRAIAAALLTPAVLGEVRVVPSVRRAAVPVADRITWRQTRRD